LGADVPVCLAGKPARMRGVGERVDPLPDLPPAWLVLVNPGVAVSTPAVFRALKTPDNPGLPPTLPPLATAQALAEFLRGQRNDLELPALSLAPLVGRVTAALAGQAGCLLARMSGSGATVFGLFAHQEQAVSAAVAMRRTQPGWWVQAAEMAR
jgi:4-diphosphocytidyl-2-C-methyl-D-erythritol kinase